MTLYTLGNIFVCACAFAGSVYGMIRFFKPHKAIYAQMITLAIGYGLSFVRMKKKLCWCGTFALLAVATIYHGIFNMLVESDHRIFGFILPAVTYVPLVYTQHLYYIRKKKNVSKTEKI